MEIIFYFQKISEEKFRRVLRRFYSVLADYKSGTCSAWSNPTRMLALTMADRMNLDGPFEPFVPTSEDLEYLGPKSHQEIGQFLADWIMEEVPD